MRVSRITLLSLVGVILALAARTGTATAQETVTKLIVSFPKEASVGDQIALNTYLLDATGKPVPNASIAFIATAEFLNTTGWVTLGKARSDESGQASLLLTPRRDGLISVIARFSGIEGYASAEGSGSLTIHPGPQLYNEAAPLRIPGANVWTVAIILSVVWGLYLVALALLWNVSREGAVRASNRG